jgi:hypothetical protein
MKQFKESDAVSTGGIHNAAGGIINFYQGSEPTDSGEDTAAVAIIGAPTIVDSPVEPYDDEPEYEEDYEEDREIEEPEDYRTPSSEFIAGVGTDESTKIRRLKYDSNGNPYLAEFGGVYGQTSMNRQAADDGGGSDWSQYANDTTASAFDNMTPNSGWEQNNEGDWIAIPDDDPSLVPATPVSEPVPEYSYEPTPAPVPAPAPAPVTTASVVAPNTVAPTPVAAAPAPAPVAAPAPAPAPVPVVAADPVAADPVAPAPAPAPAPKPQKRPAYDPHRNRNNRPGFQAPAPAKAQNNYNPYANGGYNDYAGFGDDDDAPQMVNTTQPNNTVAPGTDPNANPAPAPAPAPKLSLMDRMRNAFNAARQAHPEVSPQVIKQNIFDKVRKSIAYAKSLASKKNAGNVAPDNGDHYGVRDRQYESVVMRNALDALRSVMNPETSDRDSLIFVLESLYGPLPLNWDGKGEPEWNPNTKVTREEARSLKRIILTLNENTLDEGLFDKLGQAGRAAASGAGKLGKAAYVGLNKGADKINQFGYDAADKIGSAVKKKFNHEPEETDDVAVPHKDFDAYDNRARYNMYHDIGNEIDNAKQGLDYYKSIGDEDTTEYYQDKYDKAIKNWHSARNYVSNDYYTNDHDNIGTDDFDENARFKVLKYDTNGEPKWFPRNIITER